MQVTVNSFIKLIDIFPGSTEKLSFDMGLSKSAAAKWRQRNRIPENHWDKLIEVYDQHGVSLTKGLLSRLEIARKKEEKQNGKA